MAEPSNDELRHIRDGIDLPEDVRSVDQLRIGGVALAGEHKTFDPYEVVFSAEDVIGETALKHIQNYANLLLGRAIEPHLAAEFRQFAQEYAFKVFTLTRQMHGSATLEATLQKLYEARRYMQGVNNKVIRLEVNAPSDTTVGVSRTLCVQKNFQKFVSPQRYAQLFEKFCDGEELPNPETLVPVKERLEKASRSVGRSVLRPAPVEQTDVTVPEAPLKPTEPHEVSEKARLDISASYLDRRDEIELERRTLVGESLEQTDWEDVVAKCMQYWSAPYMEGLSDALHGYETDLALEVKKHIAGLIAIYAFDRPGQGSNETEVLPRLQWDVATRWVSYRRPKDTPDTTVEDVGTALFLELSRADVDVQSMLSDALSRLVQRARKDYAQNLYPRAHVVQVEAANSSEEAQSTYERFVYRIGAILNPKDTKYFDADAVTLLAKHFTGNSSGVEAPAFYNAGAKLREYVEYSQRYAKYRARNGGETAHDIQSDDATFVNALLPGRQLSPPVFGNLKDLVDYTNSRAKPGTLKVTEASAQKRILHVLTKISSQLDRDAAGN